MSREHDVVLLVCKLAMPWLLRGCFRLLIKLKTWKKFPIFSIQEKLQFASGTKGIQAVRVLGKQLCWTWWIFYTWFRQEMDLVVFNFTRTIRKVYHSFLSAPTVPNACPYLTLSPALTLKLKFFGASKMRTIVDPKLNPPIFSPFVRETPSIPVVDSNFSS